MKERRAYDRIKLVISATIFVRNSPDEILCDIVDISEEGMRVRISSDIFTQLKLKCNDDFDFQFIDTYSCDGTMKRELISATAKIVYMESGFGIHELGCYIRSDAYSAYVSHKKLSGQYEVIK